jgi:hypothetical protein
MLLFPLAFVSFALADEVADRAAIDHTIAALNEFPLSTGLFVDEVSSDLARLPKVNPLEYRALVPTVQRLSVTISHEPLGEARIDLQPAVEILNPHTGSGAVRFLTPDIAVVDGNWTYKNGETTEITPLFFVMKREGDVWKIASLRLLAR